MKRCARRIVAHHRAAGTNPDTALELIFGPGQLCGPNLYATERQRFVDRNHFYCIVRKYHLLPIVLAAILHMVALRRDAWRQIKVFAGIGSAVAKPCRLFKSRKHGAIRSCPYLETCLQLPSAI